MERREESLAKAPALVGKACSLKTSAGNFFK
jgi:hypothetical protein